jgi:alkaline phosphatase
LSRLPLFGLFTPDHMSYEIDRNPSQEPSLTEMAIKALNILKSATQSSDKGFFIMIEGSRIDMAAHENDPATHVHEILAYNQMVEAVLEWIDSNSHDSDTALISVINYHYCLFCYVLFTKIPITITQTSDHETGGISVAHQLGPAYPTYKWEPSELANVKNSSYILGKALASYNGTDYPHFVKSLVVAEWLGIKNVAVEDISFLLTQGHSAYAYSNFIADLISNRAEIGWATHGHSSVDVNLVSFLYNSVILIFYVHHYIVFVWTYVFLAEWKS